MSYEVKLCEHGFSTTHLRTDRNYQPDRWCPGPTFDSWVEGVPNEAASITHDDWELLEVSDLAGYGERRGPLAAKARGREVLVELHKMLFGKTVEECGCDV